MTQEDKELLLKDLCARLPYGVMLSITHNKYTDETFNARISTIDYCGEIKVRCGFEEYEQVYSLEQIKPYLFPLSSMTVEQRFKVTNLLPNNCEISFKNQKITFYEGGNVQLKQLEKVFDFFDLHHIDYRGLIPMGLANDATGKNIY